MSQPEYVPLEALDRARVSERLPTPDGWTADRIGEVKPLGAQPVGTAFGVAGPDQGYALKLCSIIRPELVLGPHESIDDAIAGCVGVALRRAALYGRAPVMADVRLAFAVWGFLPGAPADLVAFRAPLFGEISHHYTSRLRAAERIPEHTLRMTPDEVIARLPDGAWRMLHGLDG